MSRAKKLYTDKVVPELTKKFAYSSPMQVPRLTKIVVNSGVGKVTQNSKAMEYVVYALTNITGQKPKVVKSRKSIASFKLRVGLPIGCVATLRGQRMFDFFDRLVSIALPRVRDFKGVPSTGFDGRGNYTFGIKEAVVFPEVEIDKLGGSVPGMDITFVTTAQNDTEAYALLEQMGIPFRKSSTGEKQQ